MSSPLSRFADRLVTLSKHAVFINPISAAKKGDGGYADWDAIAIHSPTSVSTFCIDGSLMCFTKYTV